MDDEEASRYLRQRVPIPAAVRGHFGGATDMPRAEAAAMLSNAMHLRSNDQPALVVGMLLVLLEATARAVGEEAGSPEQRGGPIADRAVAHYTLDECLAIAEYFGGEHIAVPTGTTFGTLRAVVHELLGQCIGDPLNGVLDAWSSDE